MLNALKLAGSWVADAMPDISNLILVLVGVIMSLPKLAERIEDRKEHRWVMALICFGIGVLGLVSSVNQRRQSNTDTTKMMQNISSLVGSTNSLVTNTNTTVLLVPQVTALNSHIAELEARIKTSRGDPELLKRLTNQAQDERAQAKQATKQLLLSMLPGIIPQLDGIVSGITHDEQALLKDPKYRGYHSAEGEAGQIRSRYADQIRTAMTSVKLVGEQLYSTLPSSYTDKDPYNFKSMQESAANIANTGRINSELDLVSYRGYLTTLANTVVHASGPQAPSAFNSKQKKS